MFETSRAENWPFSRGMFKIASQFERLKLKLYELWISNECFICHRLARPGHVCIGNIIFQSLKINCEI